LRLSTDALIRDRAGCDRSSLIVRIVQDAPYQQLGGADGRRSGAAQLGDAAFDGGVELGRWYDVVHQADVPRVRRIEALAGEEERACLRGSDFRQDDGRDDRRNDTEFHLGKAEDRVVGGDGDVANRGQPCSSAQGGALDSPDDGLGAVVDGPKHVAHPFGVAHVRIEAQLERGTHPIDVGAAAKDAPLAVEDDHANVVGGGNAREGLVELGDDLGIEGVTNLGPGECDASDAGADVEFDGVGHAGRVRAVIRTGLARVILLQMKDAARPPVYRYAPLTRASHWLWVVAFVVLIGSGLQIFNASPNLDASDKSDPARRVVAIGSPSDGVGTTTIFGHTFTTTGWLGWTGDGMGSRGAHAFPAVLTIPGYQDLAGGRRWHLFFAWIATACWLAWLLSAAIKGNLREMVLRVSDIPKIWPMQAYYLKLRKDPPEYGIYNPLQKASYTAILFVVAPLVVVTGLALSPGIDAIANPLTALFGGRQFARLWHFAGMLVLVAFTAMHLSAVATQGVVNQMRSMITGWYQPR
jgi:thiosulfate reductase cytochrome b subunit